MQRGRPTEIAASPGVASYFADAKTPMATADVQAVNKGNNFRIEENLLVAMSPPINPLVQLVYEGDSERSPSSDRALRLHT
jgi:hypothetical protein